MKGTILIIDDDTAIAELLEIKLSEEGFITHAFNDGQEALEKIGQIKPDMIISDIMMPGINGYELHRRLRKDSANAFIPFIFLSGKTSPSDQLEGFRMGIDDYICKPFEFEDLMGRVQKIIQRKMRAMSYSELSEFSGNLRQIKLVDIIQLIEINKKTGELVFKKPKGKQSGKAFFNDGNLTDASMGLLNGEEAFYGLMEQTEGYFEFFGTQVESSPTITLPNMSLLLNGTRLIDEASGITKFIYDENCKMRITSREISSELEAKIGINNINYLFQLIEQGKSFKHLLNSDTMSRPRVASALTYLFKEKILEVENNFNESKELMDKELLYKIQEANGLGLTGLLEITNGSSKASICFEHGEIVHAVNGMHVGKKAFFRILSQPFQKLDFTNEPLSGIKTIESPLDYLLIEAIREMKGLKMIDNSLLDKTIEINSDQLHQLTSEDLHENVVEIAELIEKHKRIGDILEASHLTDLETFKGILDLNNLSVVNLQKN